MGDLIFQKEDVRLSLLNVKFRINKQRVYMLRANIIRGYCLRRNIAKRLFIWNFPREIPAPLGGPIFGFCTHWSFLNPKKIHDIRRRPLFTIFLFSSGFIILTMHQIQLALSILVAVKHACKPRSMIKTISYRRRRGASRWLIILELLACLKVSFTACICRTWGQP